MKKRSKVSKQVITTILIWQEVVIGGMIFIIVLLEGILNRSVRETIASLIFMFVMMEGLIYLLRPALQESIEADEQAKTSRKYVQQKLSKMHWVEVIPIKDESEHEHFLIKELPKRAKFYAYVKENNVVIFIRFNDEDALIFYHELAAEDFTTFYRV